MLNLYHSAASIFVEDAHQAERISVVLSGVLSLIICLLAGLAYKRAVTKAIQNSDYAPGHGISAPSIVESLMDIVYSVGKDNCGENFKSFLPLLTGLFFFILTTNLSGLVPGLPPATENIGTNFAMGIIVFLVYHFAGFKEHGVGYFKQFAGPMLAIAPLFVLIELISHIARPFSLSLRLMGNIFADHLMLSLFTDLTYVVVPSLLLFFGLLVAFVQSFIFTLMSAIYISMAISHDH